MDHRLDEVYDELAPRVSGYFRARGVREADDLTGDVFVKVAEGFGRFRGDHTAMRRWVFTIAHHRLVDHYRTSARRRTEPVADVPEQGVSHRAAPERCTPDDDLIRALDRLTPDQREVVVLRFVADLSIRDVAAITRKRQGAVKMLQARALESLAADLGRESD